MLAQERAEQQRLIVSQQTPSTTAPVTAEPVDPAAFIQNLPPGLRQTVLADMDDTVLAVLPSEIAAEAQALRLDRVLRHRQLMQERLLRETGMLSAILLQSSGAFHCYFHDLPVPPCPCSASIHLSCTGLTCLPYSSKP